MGIVSLILGIMSIVVNVSFSSVAFDYSEHLRSLKDWMITLWIFFGILPGILAVIFGAIGTAKKMVCAKGGLICGIIGTSIFLIGIIAYFVNMENMKKAFSRRDIWGW